MGEYGMLELFKKFGRKQAEGTITKEELIRGKIPQHVAVIMDGNGRWARSRGMPRVAGHHAGMKAVKRITIAADEIGVKALTMYAFSTENWKRPQEEVDFLMKLPQEFLSIELDELIEKNVQVRMTGVKEGLPAHTLNAVEQAIEKTKLNTGLVLNFALNYGSRHEIGLAVKRLAEEIKKGALEPDAIDDDTLGRYLQTADLPDPDLLIRTSGEQRLSNFMLWQLAYTELFFSPLYWPDFSKSHFYEAIYKFQNRSRRYGGL